MNFEGIFLKFGRDSDITQLQKQGLVYCNTVNYFKDLEGDEMRADELETSNFIGTKKDIILEIWPFDNPKAITRIATTKVVGNIVSPFGNLFCMYTLDLTKVQQEEKFFFDKRLNKKSESCLIIKNVNEFLERLHIALDKNKYSWEHHLVEYKDFSDYYGNRTIFQKDKLYEYQNEFRLFIHNNKSEVIKVELGDISDISIKLSSSFVNTGFFTKRAVNF